MPRSRIARLSGNSVSDFLKSCHTVSWWLHHLTFAPAVHKDSSFSTPSPALVIFWFFGDSRPDGHEVLSRGGFDLYISED